MCAGSEARKGRVPPALQHPCSLLSRVGSRKWGDGCSCCCCCCCPCWVWAASTQRPSATLAPPTHEHHPASHACRRSCLY